MNADFVKELFLKALDVDPSMRTRFLMEQCGTDVNSGVVEEVLSLLRAHDTSDTFLQSNAMSDAGLSPSLSASWASTGSRLGPFVLESIIGSGGMGVVFRARQESPPRPVALKIMRAASSSGTLTKRFTREAAALARLHHPCIAQVYAAGVEHRDGHPVPYLAMELVDGTPLDQFVRTREPSIRERTELIALVCEGVAHAHQRGVVHRDLKPANIVVEASGSPKILDFGIARLVDPDGTDPSHHVTAHTQRGEILGTLAYMSPEQFDADPGKIDVRSDVYSLGVILYEILAQRPAISMDKLSIAQAAMAVSTREPTPLGTINPHLRGDLETIAAKALEKDPLRRYQSAAEMSEDLRRHLRDEPILARPATALYRTRKFVRRNRAVVFLGLCVFSALTAGLVGTLWQSRKTREQSELAAAEFKATNEVNEFLAQILLSAEPEKARGKAVTMRMALDDAAARLEKGEITSPRVLASLCGTLGRAYWASGQMVQGEKYARRALELRKQVFGPVSEQVFDSIADLAVLLHDVSRDEEAVALTRPALEQSRATMGNESRVTARLINSLAICLPNSPYTRELYQEAVTLNTRLFGPEHEVTLTSMSNLCTWYMENNMLPDAEKLNRSVLNIRRRMFGDDHPDTIVSLRNLATTLRAQGKFDEALPFIRTAAEIGDRVRGPSHPNQLFTKFEYGLCLGLMGRAKEADEVLRAAAGLSRNADGTPTAPTAQLLGALGEVLVLEGRPEDAVEMARQSRDAAAAFYGEDHEEVKRAMSVYVSAYEAMQRWAEVREWNQKLRGSNWYQKKYELRPGQDPASPPEPAPPTPTPASGGG